MSYYCETDARDAHFMEAGGIPLISAYCVTVLVIV